MMLHATVRVECDDGVFFMLDLSLRVSRDAGCPCADPDACGSPATIDVGDVLYDAATARRRYMVEWATFDPEDRPAIPDDLDRYIAKYAQRAAEKHFEVRS